VTGTCCCPQLLVEMGSLELFAHLVSNCRPPNRSLPNS
jgi:hypothetical protein